MKIRYEKSVRDKRSSVLGECDNECSEEHVSILRGGDDECSDGYEFLFAPFGIRSNDGRYLDIDMHTFRQAAELYAQSCGDG
jgi:hypothetical protein